MISIKPGASIRRLQPEMSVAHTVVASIFTAHGLDTVITEGTGGVHGRASKHYVGYALDYRTKHVPRNVLGQLIRVVRESLGVEFDVVFESEGEDNEHLHIEFDPKGVE